MRICKKLSREDADQKNCGLDRTEVYMYLYTFKYMYVYKSVYGYVITYVYMYMHI
jgi:hypothetical protein